MSKENITPYCMIDISIAGYISAQMLAPRQGWTDSIWKLESVLPELVEGGSVIDRRPLKRHPKIRSWIHNVPGCNYTLDGPIKRFPQVGRTTAAQIGPYMEGAFQQQALLMALGPVPVKDPEEDADPFDSVSVSYLVRYWHKRGARIGTRVGNLIQWSDGEQQESISILPQPAIIVEGNLV